MVAGQPTLHNHTRSSYRFNHRHYGVVKIYTDYDNACHRWHILHSGARGWVDSWVFGLDGRRVPYGKSTWDPETLLLANSRLVERHYIVGCGIMGC